MLGSGVVAKKMRRGILSQQREQSTGVSVGLPDSPRAACQMTRGLPGAAHRVVSAGGIWADPD